MIDQLESYTNKQSKSKIKPHQNKTTEKTDGQAGLLQLLLPSCY